jgi:hypothetical protein
MPTDPPVPLGPRMHHVFVDGENVHQIDPTVIGDKPVNFILLLGAKQTKLDAVMLENLMAKAASVQLIRLASTGKNALDLTLSYYLGRAVLADPTGYFHVVSRDKGFEPLIKHLRSRHVDARQHDNFSTLTFGAASKAQVSSTPPSPPPTSQLAEKAQEHLRTAEKNRPKNLKRLQNFLRAHFTSAPKEEITALIAQLEKNGVLQIVDKERVTYPISKPDSGNESALTTDPESHPF